MRDQLQLLICLCLLLPACVAQEPDAKSASVPDKPGAWSSGTFSALKLRSLGPALTSGRISDIAVDRGRPARWIVGTASGGVWLTENAGTTWKPVFDGEGSYSIGCVALDPTDSGVVWVGTGENNSQRSVSYGDGVYRSRDGGHSWKRMGLEHSEHIGKIIVDPRDGQVVLVAAQGPLWASGGDRGIYRTEDGGQNWLRVLQISDDTGVSDMVQDPRDPDVLYATAYQRRRHVWTLIDGGPESAVYKSTDGGSHWRKLKNGLPSVDLGRIGLAIAPSRPDLVYAIVEAAQGKSGFFRSRDGGETWKKMSSYISSSPQYYQEIVVDPLLPDRVYSLDTRLQVTENGGADWKPLGERSKHVDNHALWIDPERTNHLLAGCDGGIYESHDRGQTWRFFENLPVTQFYRITADNDLPFYNVYGGTQDNFSLGGPARTTSQSGITNADWFVTQGGDGFKTVVDPQDPNTIYAQSQYGGLARFDRRTGESVDIRPMVDADHEALVWNWSAAILISPHKASRLYFGGNYLFKSEDRGDSWTQLGGNMTRRLDRNAFQVMGRVWGVDAVSKNRSTSIFGNIVTLTESPLEEGHLYAGTDDGLLKSSRDGGQTWHKRTSFPGVPERTYLTALVASQHAADTLYAAFDNHKQGDFKPYLLKSSDGGEHWTSISGDLPERGSVHTLVEDHVDPNLLFAGTEFGLWFSTDGGQKWLQLKGGLPTIAVRDLAIQRRESDLVLGTFGRGIFVLDDYTPLRHLQPKDLEQDVTLFPVKKTWLFVQRRPLGRSGKGFLGETYFTRPNPPVGAVFTYWLQESLKTRKARRRAAEVQARKNKAPVGYPTWAELRAEEREVAPQVFLVVTDSEGLVIRRVPGKTSKGLHRVSWDLRLASTSPPASGGAGGRGPLVVPGSYGVQLARLVDGELETLAERQTFEVAPLPRGTQQVPARAEVLAFQRRAASLQGAVQGARSALQDTTKRLAGLDQALLLAPRAGPDLFATARRLAKRLADLRVVLQGDPVRSQHFAASKLALTAQVRRITASFRTTAAPTRTQRDAYDRASRRFAGWLADLRQLLEQDLVHLEDAARAAGAPILRAGLPTWKH